MPDMSDSIPRERLERNLARVRERIAEAAARVSRPVDAIRLIAVTKTVGLPEIQCLQTLGVADVGESRIQDAERKIRALGVKAGQLHWHLIGHLQTNKADKAARLFGSFHAVDSLRVAQAVNKERLKASLLPPLPCLLEVNVANEKLKFGLPPDAAAVVELLLHAADLPRLNILGLMCMAPYSEDAEATSRPVFRRLRELLGEVNGKNCYRSPLLELSMGMSQDYAIAVEEGATMVRVGTALFT